MKPTIPKNHFTLTRDAYHIGLDTGRYNYYWPDNLKILPIEPTYENLQPLMHLMSEKWHWEDQPRYSEKELRKKLAQPGSAIFLLVDLNETRKDPVIGYTLVSRPPDGLKDRFGFAANTRIMEVDNLGLFPDNEGNGRGKAYFEMLFRTYLKDNDVVYWSQHETHSETLRRYYQEKMGMTLQEVERVPDFRPPVRRVA